MRTKQLLSELQAKGVSFQPRGGQLRVKGPARVLSQSLREELTRAALHVKPD